MTLHLVRLELAREKGHPEGSPRHGYDFVAPIDGEGHLDRAEWKAERARCTLRRFAPDADDQIGELIHTRGGHWAFSYDPATAEDDEAIFRLDRHVLRAGEYLSIRDPGNGPQHTYRIASVSKL
jgi:hypothetical protein